LLTFSFIKVYLTSSKFTYSIDASYLEWVYSIQYALIYITAILTTVTFVQYTQMALGWLKEGPRKDAK